MHFHLHEHSTFPRVSEHLHTRSQMDNLHFAAIQRCAESRSEIASVIETKKHYSDHNDSDFVARPVPIRAVLQSTPAHGRHCQSTDAEAEERSKGSQPSETLISNHISAHQTPIRRLMQTNDSYVARAVPCHSLKHLVQVL